jgi:hypothetical protein
MILNSPSGVLERLEPQGDLLKIDLKSKSFLILNTGNALKLPLYNEFLVGRSLLTAGTKTFTNDTDDNTGLQNLTNSWLAFADSPRNDVLLDASAFSNDGSLSDVTLTEDENGNPYGGMLFDGATSYGLIPNSASLGYAEPVITFSATFKINEYPTLYAGILSRSNDGFSIRLENSGAVYCEVYINEDVEISRGGPVVPLDTFITVTATYDGQTLLIYYNGVQVAELTGVEATTFYAYAAGWYIGRKTGDTFFNGVISRIEIYHRCLLPAEVTALANGQYVDPTGLVASLKTYQPSGFIDFFYLTHKPKALSFVVESDNSISSVSLSPGNGQVFYGRYFCNNLLLDSDADNIPDWLDAGDAGSLTNTLKSYGMIT